MAGSAIWGTGARAQPAQDGTNRKLEQLMLSSWSHSYKLLKRASETARDEGCETKTLPFFKLIRSEVYPAYIKPGEHINHRFVYALCPAQLGQPLPAEIDKRILHAGRALFSTRKAGYMLRPGTWADDDEIEVPSDSDRGIYEVQIEIILQGSRFDTNAEFHIE